MISGEPSGDPAAARPWKGLETSRMPVFLGYDQVERMIAALLPAAVRWQPDEVVGIARGGIVPASMAAGILALPLSFIRPDKTTGEMSWIGPPAAGRRILLVDDCCSTGTMLRRTQKSIRAEGRDCLTLVIVHDPDVAQFLPDLSHPMRELFRLPWERGEATPTGRAAKAAGANLDLSVEAPFTGLGLDETFLSALQRSREHLPELSSERAVLISCLPEADRGRILSALDATPWRQLPLVCREGGQPSDNGSMAHFKSESATRFGCTHFIDCDAGQAIVIAARAAHLLVTWWSVEARRGWTIGAAAQTNSVRIRNN